MNENLLLIRGFLFKLFIVLFIYTILLSALLFPFKEWFFTLVSGVYSITTSQASLLIAEAVTAIKLFTALVVLFPLIAVHWLIKCKNIK